MGLLRGMARTAVVAGTATHVSNNVSRRQAKRWAAKEEQQPVAEQPAEPAGLSTDEQLAQLEQLGKLHENGILTDEEFTTKKRQILGLS